MELQGSVPLLVTAPAQCALTPMCRAQGYSAAERQSILDAQAAQIEEKRALKAAEDARNAEQDKELVGRRRAMPIGVQGG